MVYFFVQFIKQDSSRVEIRLHVYVLSFLLHNCATGGQELVAKLVRFFKFFSYFSDAIRIKVA